MRIPNARPIMRILKKILSVTFITLATLLGLLILGVMSIMALGSISFHFKEQSSTSILVANLKLENTALHKQLAAKEKLSSFFESHMRSISPEERELMDLLQENLKQATAELRQAELATANAQDELNRLKSPEEKHPKTIEPSAPK